MSAFPFEFNCLDTFLKSCTNLPVDIDFLVPMKFVPTDEGGEADGWDLLEEIQMTVRHDSFMEKYFDDASHHLILRATEDSWVLRHVIF